MKASLGVFAVLVSFLAYVSTREGKFRYERSGVIAASPEDIYPYLFDLRKGAEWSPYEKADPTMKKTFSGPEAQVGSVLEFDSDKGAGAGRLEVLKAVPNELVEIKLTMTKPIRADNVVEYRLTPEADGTRFTWSMAGDGGFIGKLMNVFIDCEEMVAGQFSEGIDNLKALIEAKK